MLPEILVELFDRDIHKMIDELNLYQKEENIWKIDGDIKNSSGNLCLHLIGNLKHFIGNILGNIKYERDRDTEFNSTGITREDLIRSLEETSAVVSETLNNINEEELARDYPIELFGYKMTTGYFMVRLVAHFNYHLGQVNYHRRLIDK